MFKKITSIGFSLAIISFPHFVMAESYDIYVDKNCQETEDGTSEKPYCTISEALKNASSKKNKIYIKSGTYKEKIVLEKDIQVYGKDSSSVIIENPTTSGSTILGKGHNTIKNITIKGGYNGIALEKEGVIEKCVIKNATKNAIDLLPNDGKAEIIKNRITDNAKGIYVEADRSIYISENEFSENSEEGIDLRENITGSIKNNIVTKNGEGGIELIIGKANLVISNNTITKNRASGIAAQFYSFISKVGEVTITGNKISENKDFGLTCKNTLGGSYAEDYWDKSIELSNNTIEKNKIKAIDPTCSIIRAIDKEEEEEQKITEETETIDNKEKEISEEENKREEQEKQEQQESLILKEINEIEFNLNNYIIESENLSQEIENRGKIKLFFFGFNKEKINKLKKLNSSQEENRRNLEELRFLAHKDPIKERINSITRNLNENLLKNQIIVLEESNKKGIWGWLKNIF